jgi:predicted HAD superfamily Cof-like phosphohydrolase
MADKFEELDATNQLNERIRALEEAVRSLVGCSYVVQYLDDWVQDVYDFHVKFGHLINTKPTVVSNGIRALRFNLIEEELTELRNAAVEGDLEKVADGCADLIYVVIGTAISYGIDLRPVWAEVQKANMAKEGGGLRADGKTLKPEGWKPPDIKAALQKGALGDAR